MKTLVPNVWSSYTSALASDNTIHDVYHRLGRDHISMHHNITTAAQLLALIFGFELLPVALALAVRGGCHSVPLMIPVTMRYAAMAHSPPFINELTVLPKCNDIWLVFSRGRNETGPVPKLAAV